MTTFRFALCGASALSLAACATVPDDSMTQRNTASGDAQAEMAVESDRVAAEANLSALFERSEAGYLDRNPVAAFFRGDFSDAGSLGDLSPESLRIERQVAQSELDELRAIDRSVLSDGDRLAYDTFEYMLGQRLASTDPAVLPVQLALPLDHFRGLHVFYPRLSAPGNVMPYGTVQDYENNFSRHRDMAKLIDQSIARFRKGAADGITLPRLSVEMMIAQLDLQVGADLTESPYWAPVANFPDSFSAAEKARLEAEHAEVLGEVLMPALQKLRDYLADEYLAQARTNIAATATPNGDAYYAYRIKDMTTLPLTADEIHETGLSEVARINAALEQARAEAGGRTPQVYKSKTALQAAWYELAAKVDPLMDRLFLEQPRTELRIEPYEEYREEFSLAASYSPGKIDGTRPGTFYFSGWNAENRELAPSIALYMHEGNPGHHFETMLSYENEEIPDFLRYGGFTAYSEGWGLYAEFLGYELGLYDDPVDRIQALAGGELLRAVRLVVDTGMHAKGWSRERAIEYMVANGQPRDFAESETARYIVMPAQALAYKVGELKMKQLRAKAEAALDDDFDVREFHAQVLGSGDLPLPILEAKIDRWIAAGGG